MADGTAKNALGFDVTAPVTGKNDDLVQELIRDFEHLRGARGNWETHWTEIAQRILPMDRNKFVQHGGLQTQGEKRNQELFDSTALLALGKFSAILDSLLTPRNSFWHELSPSDETLKRNKSVQDYFHNVNKILFDHRYSPAGNFAAQNQSQYKSLGAYGTGAMLIDDVAGFDGIRYRNVHLSELYLQENHQGMVDRVCRHFMMTARQAVQKFGDELPEGIVTSEKVSPEKQFFFIHWVIPRDDRDPFRKDFMGMPFASYYISIEGRKLVGQGGYAAFPYAISRYEQSSNEAFGRSIAMDVLPSIKTLNEQKKTMLKQGHLATDPVILAADDGVVDMYDALPGTVIPGGVTADGRSLIQAMPVGKLAVGIELMNEEKSLINDSFLVSLFQVLVETPTMTATEVLERTREKGILLAPTVGRQQSEYLGPLIDRELDILARQGLLPEQPRILEEAAGEYKVEYTSPLSRAQQAEWASGAMRTVQELMSVAQATGDPSKLDYINWDVAAPAIADIHGTPSPWINSPEQIAEIRKARAQQQQQEQAIQAAPAIAGLAKAVKE